MYLKIMFTGSTRQKAVSFRLKSPGQTKVKQMVPVRKGGTREVKRLTISYSYLHNFYSMFGYVLKPEIPLKLL